MKRIDLTNSRFGSWIVMKFDPVLTEAKGLTYWNCKCDCGTLRNIPSGNLRRNQTTNCGCLQKEKTRARMSTHGDSKTKLYGVWLAMRRRCYLPSCKDFPNWGGRGITVCSEWRNDFENFKKWALESGYNHGLTLERKDTDREYSPSNCTWATRTQQTRNRRITRRVTINGITKPLAQWAEEYGINRGTLDSRLNYGWTGKELLIRSKGRGANGLDARSGGIEHV